MESFDITIPVSKSIGTVSGIVMVPDDPKAILVLAHGAGAGMRHQFMEAFAARLANVSIGTIRYNFPFMEHGKGRPDVPAVAEKTVAAALRKAYNLFPKSPIFAAGKSFGGRMSSQYLSKESPDYVKGIVFVGFPLHAPGKASSERAAHLATVKVPMLFLQGTRDALANLSMIKEVCRLLPNARIITYEGADHSFKVGKVEVIPELVQGIDGWMQALI